VSDTRIERERQRTLASSVDRTSPFIADGSAALLVTTTTVSTYPTAAAAYYATNPTEIDGNEIEGGTVSYSADPTQVVYVLNLGTQVPPVGTRAIAHALGGRWVIRYDG
jgi:hypothetical protein